MFTAPSAIATILVKNLTIHLKCLVFLPPLFSPSTNFISFLLIPKFPLIQSRSHPANSSAILIFLNHVLPCSKPLPTQKSILTCHRYKLRLNTSLMQLLDTSNSACPGTPIMTTTTTLDAAASLLASSTTPLPTTYVLPPASSIQCSLLATVALLVLRQPQLLV